MDLKSAENQPVKRLRLIRLKHIDEKSIPEKLRRFWKCPACPLLILPAAEKRQHIIKKHSFAFRENLFHCIKCPILFNSPEEWLNHHRACNPLGLSNLRELQRPRHLQKVLSLKKTPLNRKSESTFSIPEFIAMGEEETDEDFNHSREVIQFDTTRREYKCGLCGRYSRNIDSADFHLRNAHGLLYCPGCSYIPENLNDRFFHIENTHKTEGYYKCPFCRIVKANQKEWRYHLNMHYFDPKTSAWRKPHQLGGADPLNDA